MNKLIEFLEKRGLMEQVDDLRDDDIVLNLRNNQIRDDEAVTLAEALKSNNSITNFDLKNNLIENDGKKALIKAIENNYCINYLILDND